MEIKLKKLAGVFLMTAFAIAPSVSNACAWHMFSMFDIHADTSVTNDDKALDDKAVDDTQQPAAAGSNTPAHSPRLFGGNSFSRLVMRGLESNAAEVNMPSVDSTSEYKTVP